jgi:hypothetical protein
MVLDWQWGNTFLNGGRKKYERPLYDRGLRIWRDNKWSPDSDIHVGWRFNGNQSFVTYHKDGSTTIQGNPQNTTGWYGWTPLRSQSVRLTINRYAGIKVFQRNYKFYLQEPDAPISAPKIQGCRMCKQSGLVDGWCSSSTCWSGDFYPINDEETVFACSKHPDAEPPFPMSFYRYHKIPCEHGSLDSHTTPKTNQCYYCSGSGKRDYGSKPERTQWDGTPLRLRDGKIIRSAATLLERMVADYAEPIG